MENKNKALKNLGFSVISQVITIAIGFLLPRLYITSYGSEVNGLLNSLNQLIVYLSLFEAGIGAVTLQSLYGSVARNDWEKINGVLAATDKYYKRAGTLYFFSLLALAILYPIAVDSEISALSIIAATILSGIGNVFMFYCQGKYKLLLQAEGKNYIITNLTTIISVLTSMAKVILIKMGVNFVIMLAVSLIINLGQVVYIGFYVKKYPKLNLQVKPDFTSLAQRNYTLVHQLSSLVFNNTDVLVLTLFCGLKVVSVYSIYKMIVTQLEKILSAISDSVNFMLGQAFQTDRNRFIKMIDVFEMVYSTVSFCLFSVALYLFVPFVNLYTADVSDMKYADSTLAVLFVSAALLTAMRVPMLFTINYAGHFKLTIPQTIIESVLNLTISVLCVSKFGIYGVLLGTTVALLYRTNDVIIYSNVKILRRSAAKTYRIHLINIITLLVVEFLFSRLLPKTVESYFALILMGIVSVSISAMLFVGMQLMLDKEECMILIEKIKRDMKRKRV